MATKKHPTSKKKPTSKRKPMANEGTQSQKRTNGTASNDTENPDSSAGARASAASGGGASDVRELMEPLKERAAQLKDGLSEVKEAVGQELRGDWDTAKEKAREATDAARAKASEAVGVAKEKAQEAAEKAGELAERTQATAKRAGGTLLRTVKENPLPIALAGAGLTWLALSIIGNSSNGVNGKKGRTRTRDESEDGAQGAEGAVEQVKHAAEGAVTQIRSKASQLADDAGDLAGRAQSSLAHLTEEAGRSARDLAARAAARSKDIEQSVEDKLRENPLVVGAAALALGAVVGAVLPRTRIENEWLGEKRDEVVKKGQELAHRAADKVESTAKKLTAPARATASSAR
jgi:ElaB/YqjD/DUF883 family membrane-anchored ribosome-binding protein